MQKIYAMVDCNSFYASCEQLFRPDLRGKPVIVLSNNDGCVISLNQEAKNLGISMTGAFYEIESFCRKNRVHVFSSNYSLYVNISDRVMNTLKDIGTAIEVYSVDEAWIELPLMKLDYIETARMIKQKIEREIGIPVGVGIGPTKALAKVANWIGKKQLKTGIASLMELERRNLYLKNVPIGELWGIGRASCQKLQLIGLKNAYDFTHYENDKLIQKILTKTGLQLKKELQGENCYQLQGGIQSKQSISCSRSFTPGIWEKNLLKEKIASFVAVVAQRLRFQESTCLEISIYARASSHREDAFTLHGSERLIHATNDTRKLIVAAWSVMEKLYRPGLCYKKAGVAIYGIKKKHEVQLSLLDQGDTKKDDALMKLIDQVDARFGGETLRLMSCKKDALSSNQKYKSPNYTTDWKCLPKLK